MRCTLISLALLPLFFAEAETPVQKAAQQPPATLPAWAVVVEWDPVWRASAGAQFRSLGGMDWATGSYSPRAAASLIAPLVDLPHSPVGGGSGFSARTYRDGYVTPDSSTPIDGLSEVWGYTSNDQFQNGELLFHGTVYDSAYMQSQQSRDWNDDARGASAFVALDWLAVKKATTWGVFRAGVQGSVSLLPLDFDMTTSTLSAVLREESIAITDRYDLGGLLPPLAPFTGTVGGGGPLIDAGPDGRSEGAHALLRERHFSNVIQQELDVLMTSVSFGPTLEWQGHENWALQGSLGLALNVVRWEATQTETLSNDSSGASTRFVGRRGGWHGGAARLLPATRGAASPDFSAVVSAHGALRLDRHAARARGAVQLQPRPEWLDRGRGVCVAVVRLVFWFLVRIAFIRNLRLAVTLSPLPCMLRTAAGCRSPGWLFYALTVCGTAVYSFHNDLSPPPAALPGAAPAPGAVGRSDRRGAVLARANQSCAT